MATPSPHFCFWFSDLISCFHNQCNLLAFNHSACFWDATAGQGDSSEPGTLHGAPCVPSHSWLMLSCIPLVDGEIPCFPSPTEVPSWHSEPQKQVTGPQLPSEPGCPDFPQNVVQQSWPWARLRKHRAVGKRGVISCAPPFLAKAEDWGRIRTRVRSSVFLLCK